ncbi:MAG: kinase [Candidatus Omnitrophica bacterium]|nr:kinase [Candidatus Omnitrophota bacterium]
MIICRTPFRISFFGGGTDYPVWYREHGGAVLATTIDKYCYITCRYLPPFFSHKSRVVYSKIENVNDVSEIQHPAVQAVLRHMGITEGVEIHHDGDLPARTGLGSSSAFTVGLLHSLFALKQIMPTKTQLAMEAIHIERNILHENVGNQDQVSAALGGFNRIVFRQDDGLELQPVIMPRERLRQFQDHLMLYFTGFQRMASEIAKEQIANTLHRKAELERIYEMVDEALSILIGNGNLVEFGKLLHESWRIKQQLSNRITTPAINAISEAAMDAGAVGTKLLGAGGGGFMLLFVRPEDQPKVRERLKSLLYVPFRFETQGSQIIFYDRNIMDQDESSVIHRKVETIPQEELV